MRTRGGQLARVFQHLGRAGAPGGRYRAARPRPVRIRYRASAARARAARARAVPRRGALFRHPAAERHAGRHRYPVLRRPLLALPHACPGRRAAVPRAAAARHLVVGTATVRIAGRGAPERIAARLGAGGSRTRSSCQPRCGGGCHLPARALRPAAVAGERAAARRGALRARRGARGRHEILRRTLHRPGVAGTGAGACGGRMARSARRAARAAARGAARCGRAACGPASRGRALASAGPGARAARHPVADRPGLRPALAQPGSPRGAFQLGGVLPAAGAGARP